MSGLNWKEAINLSTSLIDMDNIASNRILTASSFSKSLSDILDNLEENKELLKDDLNIIFQDYREEKDGENGVKLEQLFNKWRKKSNPINTTSLILSIAQELEVKETDKYLQAAINLAIVADIKADNPYHDNQHFREVVASTMRLVATHNQLAKQESDKIGNKDLFKILIAAIGHDLNHDGSINYINGKHTPYRLEKIAIDTMIPILKESKIEQEYIDDIGTMILITDASSQHGFKSAHEYLRYIVENIDNKDFNPENIPVELRSLTTDRNLLQHAAILSDADLTPSAATTYKFNQKMTKLMHKEVPEIKVGPKTTRSFFKTVLGGKFSSIAGNIHSSSSHEKILSHATKLALGVTKLKSSKHSK